MMTPCLLRYVSVVTLAILLSSGAIMPSITSHAAPPQASGPLLPIGGGYSDIYAGFIRAALANARNGRVDIVVLPTAYSTDAEKITDAERARNLKDAEERRFQIEEACKRAAPKGVACRAVIAPIFTRADAGDAAKVAPLNAQPAAVFLLGGDQTVAMTALANTAAEAALTAAHEAGAVVAGTSAGCGMLAAEMLGGYNPNYAAANSLDFGSADVWNSDSRRGLPFGVEGALLDQHFFQRGRLGRLLNAIALPGAPAVGIGIDAYTGAVLDGDKLGNVFGLYGVAVLDAATYHAADGVRYKQLDDASRPPVLSLRNVLVHLLAPGKVSYDLKARRSSLAAVPRSVRRSFDGLRLPRGAGALLLSGDLNAADAGEGVIERFDELAGGREGRVLVYADGYASDCSARSAGEKLAGRLASPATVVTAADLKSGAPSLTGVTAIALVGRDQSRLSLAPLEGWLPGAWRMGMPILADNAMAAAIGLAHSAHGPTPREGEEAELATQRSLRAGETSLVPGLGLLDATFEPQLLADNRWGRYFSLAYGRHDALAVGLNRGAALEVSPDGAWALGDNVLFALDLRGATLSEGENRGFVIANGLLDVFAPGDEVKTQVASVSPVAPARVPTPPVPRHRTSFPSRIRARSAIPIGQPLLRRHVRVQHRLSQRPLQPRRRVRLHAAAQVSRSLVAP
jgi:cyanophycinase